MTGLRRLLVVLAILLPALHPAPAAAQAAIRLLEDDASLAFPESVTFRAEFSAPADITEVILEYGVDHLTCGTVVAKAFPEFDPAGRVQVEWTWEMRQSGSLPPGASLWWRWQVADSSGGRFTSPTRTVLWLDDQHAWTLISGRQVRLHYYSGGAAFGRQLHEAAAQALERLSREVGLELEAEVDIYIYANTDDLKDAILYEPGWVGGQAFPDYNIVIIGVTPDQLDWGMRTEAHELTHVLVGQLTFSCLGFVPSWLNEGLAMVGEGGPEAAELARFEQAADDDELLSLRSLSGNFSEQSDRANLSYAQSHSVVDFLLRAYGRDKMNALLLALRDGAVIDAALATVYGLDVDGLEDAWRADIGAAPRAGGAEATPVPTPTPVPTIVPLGGAPAAPPSQPAVGETAPAATVAPTAAGEAGPPPPTAAPPPASSGLRTDALLVAAILAGSCIVVFLAAGLVLLLTRRARRQK